MQLTRILKGLTQPAKSAGLIKDVIHSQLKIRNSRRRIENLMSEGTAAIQQFYGPEHPKGIVPLMHCGFYYDASAYIALVIELLRRDWQPIWVHGDISIPFADNSPYAEFNGGLLRHSRELYQRNGPDDRRPSFEDLKKTWDLDFEREIAEWGGDNYFPVIAGKLRRIFKCLDLDWHNKELSRCAAKTLQSTDAALSYCRDLFDIAKKTNTAVRFIGAEHLYVPAGIPMMYSKFLKDQKAPQNELFEFIDFGGAYTHFFTDGESATTSQFNAQNITKNDTYSRHEILHASFNSWIAEQESDTTHLEFGKSVLQQRWTGSSDIDPSANAAIDQIVAHRDSGGKAVWLFGHAIVELGNPSDYGAIHPTLQDWVNETVKAVQDTDLLLVIKPHPAEARHRPHRRPNQLFKDIFPQPLPKNIVFLEPLWAPLDKIFPLIDIGTVWRGSAGAQLMMERIPVIVCGMHTAYHNAIHPPQPCSAADYKEILLNPDKVEISDEQQHRAALYFSFLKEETMFPIDLITDPEPVNVDGFNYVRPSLRLDQKKLDRHIAGPVDSVSKICDTICA